MQTTKLILLALFFAFVSVTMAQAGTQIQQNQATTIKASVQNNSGDSTLAAVKLTGYDDSGTVVGHLCKNVWLRDGRTTLLEFAWQAPGYATGLYWSSKVEADSSCPTTTTSDDDEHDDHDHHGDKDDDEHDDDDHH